MKETKDNEILESVRKVESIFDTTEGRYILDEFVKSIEGLKEELKTNKHLNISKGKLKEYLIKSNAGALIAMLHYHKLIKLK